MSFLEDIQSLSKDQIDAAIAEALDDRDAFLASYGYRRATRWQLQIGDEQLDPRAILAAAMFLHTGRKVAPDEGPRSLTKEQLQESFKRFGYRITDSAPRFGEIPGYPVGSLFVNRHEVSMAGIHRQPQGGISGGKDGVESIVLNKGYEDDQDFGDTVIYTGDGGNDPATKKQIADQHWVKGNRGLQVNCDRGLPVRVIRGHMEVLGPESGYRYDGLFKVESYWQERGKSGFRICRYKLVRHNQDEGESQLDDEKEPGRRSTTTQRVIRSSSLVELVKAMHDFTCQVCVARMETQGGPYAEGAHIRPLGKPHHGPDSKGNILCLCPTCHVYFDKGGFVLDEELEIVDLTGTQLGGRRLRTVDGHAIRAEHLAYHRSLWLT